MVLVGAEVMLVREVLLFSLDFFFLTNEAEDIKKR